MGVWERFGTLLAGGAKVEIELDADRVAGGGFLSGHAVVSGGRRGLEVAGLHVSLVRTAVRPPGSSTTSEITQRTVVDNTIGSGLRLEPRETRRLQFSFRVPRDAEPSDDDTSYRVRVEAESGSGRAPKAYHPVRVVDAAAGRPTLEAILERFPGLEGVDTSKDGESGDADDGLLDALAELRWAHDAQDPERDFLAAEPRLASLVGDRQGQVRSVALEAWSSVIAGRVGDEHVRLLETLTEDEQAEADLLVAVAEAAGRMTSARGLPVLRHLADHDEPAVRRAAASAAALIDDARGRLALLQDMRQDADPSVRAVVYRGLVEHAEDPRVVQEVAGHVAVEPSAEVLGACVAVLAAAVGRGHAEPVRPVFEQLVEHPEPAVRIALARALYFAEQDEPLFAVAVALLADADAEVRYTAAAELRNLPQRGEALLDRLREMADGDESARARRGALTSLPEFVPPDELIPQLEDLADESSDPEILRGIIDGIEFRREPAYRELLETLARHPNKEVAADAEAAMQRR